MPDIRNLIIKIAEIGKTKKSGPHLRDVDIFKAYFDGENLKEDELDKRDACICQCGRGNCTRRELLTRFLFLNAVLDQGPDMEGVRQLLCDTVNDLYRRQIRILHNPEQFFASLNIAMDKISTLHESIRFAREPAWQNKNNSKKSYNLYIEGSQTLGYALGRWGTPLAVPMILAARNPGNPNALIDYLESFASSEIMSQEIKDDKDIGLGKAIGDKAAHLFAKWIIHTFPLARRPDASWDRYSFEIPVDSNVGRILWRTGFLLECADESEYKKKEVIQMGKGKNGANYIRATNIRGMTTDILDDAEKEIYKDLCKNHFRKNKRNIEIQKIPSVFLMQDGHFGTGDLDDGLMYIGTEFCFNTDTPKCDECPLKDMCRGCHEKRLITDYKT